jgi:AraC-like DNA-binding protein
MTPLPITDIDPSIRICNYFQPEKGQAWGPRIIPDYELIFIAKGTFIFETDEVIEVPAQSVLCIKPLLRHTFRHLPTSAQGIISCIHFDILKSQQNGGNDMHLAPQPETLTLCQDHQKIHDLFKSCEQVFRNYGPYRDKLLQLILKQILLHLAGTWQNQIKPPISKHLESMLESIRKNPTRNISRNTLAEEFGYTPEHINYLFKKEMGITPTEFITREKMLLAQHLIQYESLSVKQAAFRVGINDQYYFSRLFKKYLFHCPSRYKETFRQ